MDDDLGISAALASVFDLVRDVNRSRDFGSRACRVVIVPAAGVPTVRAR